MLAGMLKLVNRITLSSCSNAWSNTFVLSAIGTTIQWRRIQPASCVWNHRYPTGRWQSHKGKRTWTLTLNETAVGSHKQLPRQTFTSRPRIYIWATARLPWGDVVYFWRRQFLTLSSHLLFPPTSETTLVSAATFWTRSHARQNASVGNVALYQPL